MTVPHKVSPDRARADALTRTAGIVLVLVLALVIARPGWADCTVGTQSVNFGSYDTFSVSDLDGTGSIDVTCSPSASYTISLSPGGGTYSQRILAGSGGNLDYNLFTSASRSVVWGDGTGATSTVSGSGTSSSHTVYGRVPAEQNLPAGNYSDTLVVTVTF